jgi:hypothetical protein
MVQHYREGHSRRHSQLHKLPSRIRRLPTNKGARRTRSSLAPQRSALSRVTSTTTAIVTEPRRGDYLSDLYPAG